MPTIVRRDESREQKPATGTAAIAGVATALEACAAAFVKENRLPGAAVGVVRGDDLVWPPASVLRRRLQARSRRRHPLPDRLDHQDLHRDGDHAAARRGPPCTWTTRSWRTYPSSRAAGSPFGAIETVTIRRLLSHESGLIGDPPGTDWSGQVYEGDPAAEPGPGRRDRDHGAAQHAAEVLEHRLPAAGRDRRARSGTPYARVRVRRRSSIRSACRRPRSSRCPPTSRPACATGYAARGFSDELQLSPAMPRIEAEGGLWSCVEDLARWISAQFSEDGGAERAGAPGDDAGRDAPPPLPRGTRHGRRPGGSAGTRCGGSGIWVQHSGGLHGFTSNVCFDPKAEVGAIVLVNHWGRRGICDGSGRHRARGGGGAGPIEPPAPLPDPLRSARPLRRGITRDLLRVEWRDGKLTLVVRTGRAGGRRSPRPARRTRSWWARASGNRASLRLPPAGRRPRGFGRPRADRGSPVRRGVLARARAPGGPPRSWFALPEHQRGVDQREVGERLREVAELAAGDRVVLLGQQADVVAQAEQALEELARLGDAARMPARRPARTCRPGRRPRPAARRPPRRPRRAGSAGRARRAAARAGSRRRSDHAGRWRAGTRRGASSATPASSLSEP